MRLYVAAPGQDFLPACILSGHGNWIRSLAFTSAKSARGLQVPCVDLPTCIYFSCEMSLGLTHYPENHRLSDFKRVSWRAVHATMPLLLCLQRCQSGIIAAEERNSANPLLTGVWPMKAIACCWLVAPKTSTSASGQYRSRLLSWKIVRARRAAQLMVLDICTSMKVSPGQHSCRPYTLQLTSALLHAA